MLCYSKDGRHKLPKSSVSASSLLSNGEIPRIYDGFMVMNTFGEKLGLTKRNEVFVKLRCNQIPERRIPMGVLLAFEKAAKGFE